MRALIHDRLQAAVGLAADDTNKVAQRVYIAGSLGIGNIPADPDFPRILINELPSTPYLEVRRTSRSQARVFQIHVQDVRGSLVRIDHILTVVRETILGLVLQVSPTTGARCTESVWEGDSLVVPEPQGDYNIKYGQFRLTSNQ